MLEDHLHRAMHDGAARLLTARIRAVANRVTQETDVLFVVSLETDADREREWE